MATRIKRDIFTGELVEEEYEPSPCGRSIIGRETKCSGRPISRQKAIREDKKHVSKSLGVPVAQVDRFNNELEKFGVTDARYSKKTGFIESTSDDARHAAWAIRGHFNPDGGNNADKWANALGY